MKCLFLMVVALLVVGCNKKINEAKRDANPEKVVIVDRVTLFGQM